MLPFYSWILVLISVVRRRRNVIKTREIVSAKQREEHPYPGTYICLPVLGDGDQLASPKLEQDILVGSGGYFYLELFIWSPYVSHFEENPSVCLFLAEMQVKIHNCTTPSCWHHIHHMMSWMLSTLGHICKVKNSLLQKQLTFFTATQLLSFSFMHITCIIYLPMQMKPSLYSTPLVAPIYKELIQRQTTSFSQFPVQDLPVTSFKWQQIGFQIPAFNFTQIK